MAAKVAARSALAAWTKLDLPSVDQPQVVNSEGYELDEAEIAALHSRQDGSTGDQTGGGVNGEADDALDAGDEEEMALDLVEGSEKEQLLSLAESLVLHYSLVQTRNHHLSHLLPLIFSHPPIPSHNRPRARVVHKPGLNFPTPQQPETPLPAREYHGPSRPTNYGQGAKAHSSSPAPSPMGRPGPGGSVSVSSPTPSSPAPSADTTTPLAGPSTPSLSGPPPPVPGMSKEDRALQLKAAKAARRLARIQAKEAEAPAHEIECITRCELGVGPIRFPGTELWVGRFVEPKMDGWKRERVSVAGGAGGGTASGGRKRESGEQGSSNKAQKAKPNMTSALGSRPPGAPGQYPARPPYPSSTPVPNRPTPGGPASTAPPLGAGAAAGARANIPPALIQRVNQAATRYPWLSTLIHKAARNQASQAELAQLGKVVMLLSRGEAIEKIPEALSALQGGAGPAPASLTSTTTAPPRPPPAGAAAPGAGQSRSAPPAPSLPPPQTSREAEKKDDSSDEEPDMTGPPQEGGGPLPLPFEGTLPQMPPTASAPRPPPPHPPAVAPAPALARPVNSSALPSTDGNEAASASSFPSGVRPPPASSTAYSTRPPSGPSPVGVSQPTSAGSQPPSSARPPLPYNINAPPPPRPRQYPLPPPFLLVAFAEHQTEKFLLPLGMGSFISRVGGDYVTDPRPVPQPAPRALNVTVSTMPGAVGVASIASAGTSATTSDTPKDEPKPPQAVVEAPQETIAMRNRRNRASLAAQAEAEAKAKAEADAKAEAERAKLAELDNIKAEDGPQEPPTKMFPTAGLPPLPGQTPPRGTVLISVLVPADEWTKVDWDNLGEGIPFGNPLFDKKEQPVVKQEPSPAVPPPAAPVAEDEPSTTTPGPAETPRLARTIRPVAPETAVKQPKKEKKPQLINLAAFDFLPDDEPVYPVTIRLGGVDDRAWARMKNILDQVERAEMAAMLDDEPELLPPLPEPETAVPTPNQPPAVPVNKPRRDLTPLKPIYLARKRSRFSELLNRVPSRTFLRTHLPTPPPEVADALTDRWAPRPYPLSTRPLYLTSPPPEGEDDSLPITLPVRSQAQTKIKRKRGEDEAEVEFEMPVSLDALDERVEEGARASLGRRGGKIVKLKKKKEKVYKAPKEMSGKKRAVAGKVCEGCAGEGLKVWRRGPRGAGTLCKECGDKWQAGKLKEADLKAPGAASQPKDESTGQNNADAGDDTKPDIASAAESITLSLDEANIANSAAADTQTNSAEDLAPPSHEAIAVQSAVFSDPASGGGAGVIASEAVESAVELAN